MAQKNVHLVFVYGTLRQGGHYHGLLSGSRLIESTYTKPEYDLVDLGEYPGMLPGGRSSVAGEIYEVDDDTLQELDVLEECPELYTRERISLIGHVDVWGYLYRGHDAQKKPRILSGDWFSR